MMAWPCRSAKETPDITGRADEPWWTREAITIMDSFLHPDMDVVEWGSGASSIWLAARCGSLITIDSNPGFYNMVRAALQKAGYAKEKYCAVLRPLDYRYYTCAQGIYDVAIVDGRTRVACCNHAVGILKPGGLLLLDNAERPRYQLILKQLSSWER